MKVVQAPLYLPPIACGLGAARHPKLNWLQ